MNDIKPGTDAALRRIVDEQVIDVESARKWLGDALACLNEPLDGFSIGNAENQTRKALAALGHTDPWVELSE